MLCLCNVPCFFFPFEVVTIFVKFRVYGCHGYVRMSQIFVKPRVLWLSWVCEVVMNLCKAQGLWCS